MYKQKLQQLLERVRHGDVTVEQALEKMRGLPYEDLGFAKVDHQRCLNKDFPEVIYCPGKTTEQIVEIAQSLLKTGETILATKAGEEVYTALKGVVSAAEYNFTARAVVIRGEKPIKPIGCVSVISAGTADLPVAEEAALTAELTGSYVDRIYDVGVAGIHRLLDHWERLDRARVLVVVAGMEGALASVVGGLTTCPVIAVPTSVGYGAHFGGLAPLLAMLNSCATGVVTVNIDNGFGAGYSASLINQIGERKGSQE